MKVTDIATDNADKVTETEEEIQELFREHYDLDRDTFEKDVRGFMMLTERPFIMDKDDSFARN